MNDVVGGSASAFLTQNDMRPARGHGVKPEAVAVRVFGDDPLVRERVASDGDGEPVFLEADDFPFVFLGTLLLERVKDRISHRGGLHCRGM